jgi:hypothetical protein
MTTAVPLVSEGLHPDEFALIVNDKPFSTSVAEAVLLSPAVCEQFQVDACARMFLICDPEIDSTDFSSLQSLVAGVETILQKSHQKSLNLLSQQLCNVGLERFFFGLWSNSTVKSIVTLSSAFAAHSRVSLQSISDVSLLSVDALDSMLSSESLLVNSEDALLRILVPLGHPSLLRHIQWRFVSTAAIASLCEDLTESLWLTVADRLVNPPHVPSPVLPAPSSTPPAGWHSLILSEFPPLFEEFRMKRWLLLWRGSRDGFTAEEFHDRCDGHTNTLTLILDTDGNVFGGFTPVEWESDSCWKSDSSLRSFLFTLRNPHGVSPRIFALGKDKERGAIYCDWKLCAGFGWYDICISDNCNTNRNSYTRIGTRYGDHTYANDTAFRDFFTGAENFTVKEIEVFEIPD